MQDLQPNYLGANFELVVVYEEGRFEEACLHGIRSLLSRYLLFIIAVFPS